MEGCGTHLGNEYEEIAEKFSSKAFTPLVDLPIEFRNEIDRGFSTGFSCIDYYLAGIRLGELTIITAETGVGKTTFCTQLAFNLCLQKIPIWINSWEMKPATIMRKIASLVLRKPMRTCLFTDHESNQFDLFAMKYSVYVNQNTIGTDIEALSKQLIKVKELGVKIVMLDHLDYLVDTGRESAHEDIKRTIKKLHELAFSLDMHFLLICHPKQAAKGEEVGMHSLKGSSSLKQYADNLIILHRCKRTDSQADENKVKVEIAKNRMFGKEGVTYLYYEPLWDGYLQLKD